MSEEQVNAMIKECEKELKSLKNAYLYTGAEIMLRTVKTCVARSNDGKEDGYEA